MDHCRTYSIQRFLVTSSQVIHTIFRSLGGGLIVLLPINIRIDDWDFLLWEMILVWHWCIVNVICNNLCVAQVLHLCMDHLIIWGIENRAEYYTADSFIPDTRTGARNLMKAVNFGRTTDTKNKIEKMWIATYSDIEYNKIRSQLCFLI